MTFWSAASVNKVAGLELENILALLHHSNDKRCARLQSPRNLDRKKFGYSSIFQPFQV
jgi:hypothetical protein